MNLLQNWYVSVPLVLAMLIVPFMLGSFLSRRLRMPDHNWRIGLILFAFLSSLAVTVIGWPPKLGVDLSGGLILVYEVDQAKKLPGDTVNMEKLIEAVSRRVNPGGQKEIPVRTYGPEQIQVVIPEVEGAEAKQIEQIISTTGALEFRILANNRDHRPIIERALQEPSASDVKDSSGKIIARWVPVDPEHAADFTRYTEIARRPAKIHGKPGEEILVMQDTINVTGARLVRASADFGAEGPYVSFVFDSTGGEMFAQLTSENLPDKVQDFTRKLGIILDGELKSAPSIQSTISTQGQITGSFTQQEVDRLVNVLNAGSLPAALNPTPISRMFIGPTLGQDTIREGTYAMVIACILVPLFMVWYYRFAGLVADLALALNMLMLLAIMIAINARFTLTGFAGLALTVGMAVDNNVLVFERLREELQRGATLRMAIRNAFQRAGATIIDCNLTHLLASTVLYVIGTEQVKGFAVTLWLGCAISMFTSVFAARVVFEIAEKRQWITRLKMLHVIRHTNIDFMRWFPWCATASVLVTILGLVVAGVRGQGLFDIDFTGGVSVQAKFRKPHDSEAVSKPLKDLPDMIVTPVYLQNEPKGTQWEINTSLKNLQQVQDDLKKNFGSELVANTMEFKPPEVVAPPKAAKPPLPPPAERPAAEKPVTEKPVTEKPAAEKPATGPTAKDQSRSDLPPDSVLALADSVPWVVAQAGTSDKAPPAAGTGGTETKAPETKAAEAKTPDTKAAESSARPSNLAANPAPPPPAAGAASPAPEMTRSQLTFGERLNHQAVVDLVHDGLQSMQLDPNRISFEVSNEEYDKGSSQTFTDWEVKIQLPPDRVKALLTAVQQEVARTPYFPASTEIGGAVAEGTRLQAVYALVASWMLIILYLWIRFQRVAFGVAAVIALIHDVLVMLGAVAASYYLAPYLGFVQVEAFKINLPIVAAFLTIIGYSVNDTIVVFDRVREVRGKDPNLTPKMINDSTNQTLSRTLLTSFTVFLVVIVLYFFGGRALHGFAFSLIIGVATGTYSSIYVAAPILLWMIGSPRHQEADAEEVGSAR